MIINDTFQKPIGRDLRGVIVVGNNGDNNAQQELEEYVVTKELQKHFATFFHNYRKGVENRTPKTGVWISGFFGSGKSHFLKILSYLLENKEVGGKRAIDYFIDDHKIVDKFVLADMQLAAEIPTDVILFNIDSKSEQGSKDSKNAIVSVFLKVFYDLQGFCGSKPYIAELERSLSKLGRYDEFQNRFEGNLKRYKQETSKGYKEDDCSWKNSYKELYFYGTPLKNTLIEMGYMDGETADRWFKKILDPYEISIENFAQMVRDYLNDKDKTDGAGNKHNIVFLVDEMGQYIGDDSRLMLNLQTLQEEFSKECPGRAWIIVTSQQDIDSITNVKGNDFSKIQGRFDTRISLSSANVDEVIKKRILEKTAEAEETLRLLYGVKETVLKNILVFKDTAEMKLYTGQGGGQRISFKSIPLCPINLIYWQVS